MLVFNRKQGQRIRIGDAELVVIETHRGWCKLGIEAPRTVLVLRSELDAGTAQRPPTSDAKNGGPKRL